MPNNSSPPAIMGILNVTPDSFSGDGLMLADNYVAASVALAGQMLEDGATILDIGGESSRPGAVALSVEEEMRRVVPVVAAVHKKFPDAIIAVDTIKAAVADEALKSGATIINDISALAGDAGMATVIHRHKARVVLMHNRSNAKAVAHDEIIGGEYKAEDKEDIIATVLHDLGQRIDVAKQAGITDDKIILDPGIGFGKTLEQNLALINHTGRLKQLGYPVLIGASRKSFIGRALDLTVDERLEGTAACIAVATLRGADILRVHDVKAMARVARMTHSLAQN